MRIVLVIVVALVIGSAGVAEAQLPPPAAACTTMDPQGRATDAFRAGAEAVVRGEHFAPNTIVLLSFQQAPQTAELGRYQTDAAGTFTTEATGLRTPGWAAVGEAAIRASSAGASALCPVRIIIAAVTTKPDTTRAPVSGDPNKWFVVWGSILAVGGGVLTFAAYRLWQSRRLHQAMSRIDGDDSQDRAPAPVSRSKPPARDDSDLVGW